MWKRKANWFTGFRSADNRWNSLGRDWQGEWLRAQQLFSGVEDLGMRDYAAAVKRKLQDLPPADPATLWFGFPERGWVLTGNHTPPPPSLGVAGSAPQP